MHVRGHAHVQDEGSDNFVLRLRHFYERSSFYLALIRKNFKIKTREISDSKARNYVASSLLQLQLLKLLNRLLKPLLLTLQILKLSLLLLLQLLRDLGLVVRIIKNLLLLLHTSASLLKLLVSLCNLVVDVDAAGDAEVDDGGGGDWEGDAARWTGLAGWEDGDAGDALAEGFDGWGLLSNGVEGGGVEGLDVD